MVPTRANGQPAAATYRRGPDGAYHAYGIVVLTAARTVITGITVFADPRLLTRFGLPLVHPGAAHPARH
jgi:RNA polymerase sigma-70 factor (ECF subfamily)